jgi:hypothetical protein
VSVEPNEQHYQRLLSDAATLLVMRYLGDLVEQGASRTGLEIMFLEEVEKKENSQIPMEYLLNLVRKRYEKEAAHDPQ